MALKKPKDMARTGIAQFVHDREKYLLKLDRYERGEQDDPYIPDSADAEYRLLAKRAITNVMPFTLAMPAQSMYVDAFRRGSTPTVEGEPVSTVFGPTEARTDAVQPEWDHWQHSRLDARQAAIYRGAFKFGHSFVVTEKDGDKVLSRGLSALTTVTLYRAGYSATDDDPVAAIHVTKWPGPKDSKGVVKDKGTAIMWDDTDKYEVLFDSKDDLTKGVTVKSLGKHGASVCPVTRFAAAVDLEGRTVGLVEPLIPLQDRLNQTIFDMLIVQSFASFKVRTISGMAPPTKMKPIDANGDEVLNPAQNEDKITDWVPVIDPATGRTVPENVNVNARRIFWAVDEDTKFGTLDETPLDGFIKAIELAFQHIAALSQTPPHNLLGKIANLSAEALLAAESALSRKVDEFRAAFGESWERVFRIAAEIGEYEGAEDFHGEVIWRDMGQRSLAQAADALGKLHSELGIPQRGLWRRVPNVTANELAQWEEMYEEDNSDVALARAATPSSRPSFRQVATPPDEQLGVS